MNGIETYRCLKENHSKEEVKEHEMLQTFVSMVEKEPYVVIFKRSSKL